MSAMTVLFMRNERKWWSFCLWETTGNEANDCKVNENRNKWLQSQWKWEQMTAKSMKKREKHKMKAKGQCETPCQEDKKEKNKNEWRKFWKCRHALSQRNGQMPTSRLLKRISHAKCGENILWQKCKAKCRVRLAVWEKCIRKDAHECLDLSVCV